MGMICFEWIIISNTEGLPLPTSSASSNPVLITVHQKPETGDSREVYKITTFTGLCIPIQSTLVPTVVQLHPPHPGRSYQILGFPSHFPISEAADKPIISEHFDGTLILNRRRQLCSFKLGQHPKRKLDVTFIGRRTIYERTVMDYTCHNLCDAAPWASYSHSVEIRRKNGNKQKCEIFYCCKNCFNVIG